MLQCIKSTCKCNTPRKRSHTNLVHFLPFHRRKGWSELDTFWFQNVSGFGILSFMA